MEVVVLVLLALAAGTAVGYACGGRLRQLAKWPPVRSRLILTALAIYVLGVAGSWAWAPLLPALSAGCWLVLAFYAWLNRRRDGARLIALGLASNAVVILLNGAMPISPSAEERAGAERVERALDHATTLDDATVLPWLAKTIPVAFPARPEVVSPGDIAVSAGAAVVVAGGMTRRRAPAERRGMPEARRPMQERRTDHVPDVPADVSDDVAAELSDDVAADVSDDVPAELSDDTVPAGSQPAHDATEAGSGRATMSADAGTERASPRASA